MELVICNNILYFATPVINQLYCACTTKLRTYEVWRIFAAVVFRIILLYLIILLYIILAKFREQKTAVLYKPKIYVALVCNSVSDVKYEHRLKFVAFV